MINYYTTEIARTTKDPEILKKILERGKDDYVSQYAARNPNCPPELLKMVLERNKNDGVSQIAANNPNCPHEAYLKWMLATGQITRYNPKKHKMDIVPKRVDEDLKKLEDLVK